MGSRTLTHTYDTANRLTSLSGSQSIGFSYDANGNVRQRGAQGFVFDIGNRLTRATAKADYSYDGHGRRVWVRYADNSTRLQVYSQAGQLLYGQHSSQGITKYVYLGDKLIAEVTASGTTYTHNDALGSPVARTSGGTSPTILSSTRYEPYGATAAGTNPNGIGFTGHVNDVDTGLVYMQQRYYEPLAGRFLSVDPVTTDANTGHSFNRYEYGNGSPYKFKDPDGRAPKVDDGTGEGRLGGPRVPESFARDSSGRFVQYTPAESISRLQATRNANGLTLEGTLSGAAAKGTSNPVPSTMARVIPQDTPATTLGRPAAGDVFVTGASDIAGMTSKQIAQRLTIAESPVGFKVFEFATPKSGVASPVFRSDPGFVGGGRTAGGAREYVIPNGPIPADAIIRAVP